MQRIQVFLREPEIPEWASSLNVHADQDRQAGRGIGFDEAVFEWDTAPKNEPAHAPRFQLGPLNISFPEGKLTLVAGATGAGKSALLNALLGGDCSFTIIGSLTRSCHVRDALRIWRCAYQQGTSRGRFVCSNTL
jgi:hypothetical protein